MIVQAYSRKGFKLIDHIIMVNRSLDLPEEFNHVQLLHLVSKCSGEPLTKLEQMLNLVCFGLKFESA